MKILTADKKPIPTIISTPFSEIEMESIITEHGLRIGNRITVNQASWEDKSDEDFTIVTYVNFDSVQKVTVICSNDGIRVILCIKDVPYTFHLVIDEHGYNELVAEK